MPNPKKINGGCPMCSKKIAGRTDKIFCSTICKNHYHLTLRARNLKFTRSIDIYLHRNRSILFEIMGDSKNKTKVARDILDKKKFRFDYHTHHYINKNNKMWHCIYDFAWMKFSDQEILIIRNKK